MTSSNHTSTTPRGRPSSGQFSILRVFGWVTFLACIFAFIKVTDPGWAVFFLWAGTSLLALQWRADRIELGAEFLFWGSAGGAAGGVLAVLGYKLGLRAGLLHDAPVTWQDVLGQVFVRPGMSLGLQFSWLCTFLGGLLTAVIALLGWGIARAYVRWLRTPSAVQREDMLPIGQVAFVAASLLFGLVFLLAYVSQHRAQQ